MYSLTLFITGNGPASARAEQNLRRICDHAMDGQVRLEIVDVLQSPELAEEEGILATPTLIKRAPPPIRRLIGDLSDEAQVLAGLDFYPSH
ncbi:KaiB domain protein [Desulfovibrio sp. X2]|uniref:circadian clock KaiB family protein n=1 Tax=Desulfovibrio sp. X2 TaxID=941449 RepID=UPI000358DB0F|nr:circadian clock KaiB family protein [Desulfovibrio sp. X2]EPR44409.1 KaiB domain protein [Desulfovibrio sp. X2]